jgi:Uncharacterized conserved protein
MSFLPDNQTGGESRVIVEKKLKEPDRYRVLLHNDDYTSMTSRNALNSALRKLNKACEQRKL